MVAAAIIGGAAISGVTSLAGGAMASGAAGKAASASKEQQAQTRADLLPYNTAGQSVLPAWQALALSGPNAGGPDYIGQASGERPGMTQADLEATPGYQFVRAQGLKATQAAAAARGLGVSGASLKGAATYATGLADNTYANRFNEQQQRFTDLLSLNTAYQGNVNNQASRLSGIATLGENAAAQTGAQGTASATQQGNALIAGGQAEGSALKGVGNAVNSGVNNYLGYQAYQNAQGTGGYGTAGAPGSDGGVYGGAITVSDPAMWTGGL